MADDNVVLPSDPKEILAALERLAVSLQELNDQDSAPKLSHYRHLPDGVAQAYELLQQGAALVYNTSTKYTLMGKINTEEQSKMAKDLLKGCQYVGTGCLVLHDNHSGCACSTRKHAKQASRAIVNTVIQLMQAFLNDPTVLEKDNSIGAQKTGAVWQTCNTILEKKLPQGNRNAMRRDLFTYMMECNETMQEFQQLIDEGPSLREENEEKIERTNEDSWAAFLNGQDEQYTVDELPIATACIALIKISRGTINATLQACEAAGQQLSSENDDDDDILKWIQSLHRLARAVGENMTDLGAALYPPLQLMSVEIQVETQAEAIEQVLEFLLDASSSLNLPEDVTELATKLQTNIQRRRQEALDSIATAAHNISRLKAS